MIFIKYFLFFFILFIIVFITTRKSKEDLLINSTTLKKVNVLERNKKLVIDSFSYFQESMMLSIRLARMNEFVDYFLIVTTNETHSNKPLEISFSPFESYIEKFKHKIIYYNFTFPSYCTRSWCRDNYHRNQLSLAVRSFNISDESIVIVSDIDEIPTPEAMKYIIKNPPKELYMLYGYMYYYNYRHKLKDFWPGVIIVTASNCNKDMQKYRDNRYSLYKTNSIPVFPSQTHCSYCYDKISQIQKKLYSFPHIEYNKPPYTDREYILKCIKSHISIFDKSKFEVVKYDENLLPLPNDNRFNFLKEEFSIN